MIVSQQLCQIVRKPLSECWQLRVLEQFGLPALRTLELTALTIGWDKFHQKF